MNLLADMGAQPSTLQAGLVAATASTDVTAAAPLIITLPLNGATLAAGRPITITGTAADTGRRVSGASRSRSTAARPGMPRPARRTGATRLDARSGAIGVDARRGGRRQRQPRARRAVAGGQRRSRPEAGATLPVLASGACAWRAGVGRERRHADRARACKFRADDRRLHHGVRFYKSRGNTGTHVGHLWSRERHAARRGDVHRRDRAPAGRRRCSARRSRSRRTPPTSRRTTARRLLRVQRRRTSRRQASSAARCALLADGEDGPNGVYRLRRRPASRQTRSSRATTGSTSCSTRTVGAGRDAAHRGVGARPARGRQRRVRSARRCRATFNEAIDRGDRERRNVRAARDAAQSRSCRHASATAPPRARSTLTPVRAARLLEQPTPRRCTAAAPVRASRTPPATRSRPTCAWSFTTPAAPPPPPDEGPGGPILVISVAGEPVQPLLRRDPAHRRVERCSP